MEGMNGVDITGVLEAAPSAVSCAHSCVDCVEGVHAARSAAPCHHFMDGVGVCCSTCGAGGPSPLQVLGCRMVGAVLGQSWEWPSTRLTCTVRSVACTLLATVSWAAAAFRDLRVGYTGGK